jgi:hypothetical protein
MRPNSAVVPEARDQDVERAEYFVSKRLFGFGSVGN